MNNNWKEVDNKLVREFVFKDFIEAMRFINQVAEIANTLDHHPEIYNVYNKVKLELSTHDAGGIITNKDREFVKLVDDKLKEF